ncbi:hypothetical protein ACSAZK_01760 [Methanosarcina sp. Mfa9]|uniref:hypothetical protein n=1 Tax=Methanosarcina sp. Mfa9 TaxID=3439063 RepID=UPI003F874987
MAESPFLFIASVFPKRVWIISMRWLLFLDAVASFSRCGGFFCLHESELEEAAESPWMRLVIAPFLPLFQKKTPAYIGRA